MSDYTVVEPKEVKRILLLLRPYVRLKQKQVELGLIILQQLETCSSAEKFLEICKLVDRFQYLNYSKKRTITSRVVQECLYPCRD